MLLLVVKALKTIKAIIYLVVIYIDVLQRWNIIL